MGAHAFATSEVDDAAEALDAVEKRVALLDGVVVEASLGVGTNSVNNGVDLVNLGVEPLAKDEARELAVEKLDGDAKVAGHVLELDALVGLEQLRVGPDAHFATEKGLVGGQPVVALEMLGDEGQRAEEDVIVAVVERRHGIGHLGRQT